MSSYKDLFKNIGVLLISRLGTSVLLFLLIPLYTAILSTEDYGNYDIIYTTVTLLFPLLTISISDGATRFLLDKEINKENIVKKCFSIVNSSVFIVVVLTILNNIFHAIPALEQYSLYFILFYAAYAYNVAISNIARGLDRLKDVAINGIISSTLVIVSNIVFLPILRMGIDGYFLATIIANVVASFYLIIKTRILSDIFKNGYFSKPRERELVKYSRPLMLNSLSWWINDVSDRYIVAYMCGAAANGVYSVAYKIPSILSVVHGIFNQAWLISVTKEYKQNNNLDFVRKTMKIYSTAIILSGSLLIVLNKFVAKILYSGEFYNAWQYVPFLLVSATFAAIASAISIIFSAEKNSRVPSFTTAIGAVLNIIMNFILIGTIGVIGAAISTALSNVVVFMSRLICSRKYIKLSFGIIEYLSFSLLFIQATLYMFVGGALLFILQVIIFMLILALNIKTIKEILDTVFKKRKYR